MENKYNGQTYEKHLNSIKKWQTNSYKKFTTTADNYNKTSHGKLNVFAINNDKGVKCKDLIIKIHQL